MDESCTEVKDEISAPRRHQRARGVACTGSQNPVLQLPTAERNLPPHLFSSSSHQATVRPHHHSQHFRERVQLAMDSFSQATRVAGILNLTIQVIQITRDCTVAVKEALFVNDLLNQLFPLDEILKQLDKVFNHYGAQLALKKSSVLYSVAKLSSKSFTRGY